MATEFKVTVKSSGGDYTSAGSIPMSYSLVTSVAGSYTSLSGDIADGTAVTWSGGSGTLTHLTSVSKSGSDMFLIRAITGTALSNGTTVSGGGQSFVVSGTPTEGVQLTIEAYVVGDTAFFSQPSTLVTSSTCYIKVVTPSSARHAGYWDTSKAYFNTSEIRGQYANHVKLEGLQITTSSTTAALRLDYYTASDCWWEIDSCILRSASYRGISYGYVTNPPIIKVRNTVLDQAGTYSAYAAAACTAYFHNCTFRNAVDRTLRSSNSSANTYLKNCLLDNGSGTGVDIYVQSGNVYLDHVATGDDTADDFWTNTTKLRTGTTTSDGSGDNTLRDSGTTFPGVKVGMRVYRTTATTSYANVTSIAQASSGILGVSTNVFGNGIGYEIGAVYINASVSWVGTDDSHLQSGDTAARGKGKDLSSDSDYPVTVDIDGNSRSAWDLGADEYASSATLSASDNIPTSEYAANDSVVEALSSYENASLEEVSSVSLDSLSSTLDGFDNIGTFDTYGLDIYDDISEDNITVEEFVSVDLASQSIGAYDAFALEEYIPSFASDIFILSYEEPSVAEYVPSVLVAISIEPYEELAISDYAPNIASDVFLLVYEEFGNAESSDYDLASGQYSVIINDVELLFGYTPLLYDEIGISEYGIASSDSSIEAFESIGLADVCAFSIYTELTADNIGIEEYVLLSGVADFGLVYDTIGADDIYYTDTTSITYDDISSDDYAELLSEAFYTPYEEIGFNEYAVYESYSDLGASYEEIGSSDFVITETGHLSYDEMALTEYADIFSPAEVIAYDEIALAEFSDIYVPNDFGVIYEDILSDDYALLNTGEIISDDMSMDDQYQSGTEHLGYDDILSEDVYSSETGIICSEDIGADDICFVYLPEILCFDTIAVTEDASYSVPGESVIVYESPSPTDDIVLLDITGIYYEELRADEYSEALGVASEVKYDDIGIEEEAQLAVTEEQYEPIYAEDVLITLLATDELCFENIGTAEYASAFGEASEVQYEEIGSGDYVQYGVTEEQYESVLMDESFTLSVSHIAYDEYHIDDAYLTETSLINYETIGLTSDQYQLYTPGGYAVDDSIHADDWLDIYVYTEITNETASVFDNYSMGEYALVDNGLIAYDGQGSTDYAYQFLVGFNVESYDSVYADAEYYTEAITNLHFEELDMADERQLFDVGYCQVFDDLSLADELLYGSSTVSYEDIQSEDVIYTHGGLIEYEEIGTIEFTVNGDLFADKYEEIACTEYVNTALQAWNPVQIIANRYSVTILAQRSGITLIANHVTADLV